jgi:catechol 2,3-dioxygenase-like lactoylglutathione lyase family enzyme
MTATLKAVHPVLAAHDVATSVRWYRRLGFDCVFADDAQAPRYAVLRRDGVELHLQWADAGQWVAGLDRPVCRLLVDDVDALHREWADGGAISAADAAGSPYAQPADTPWGTREFHLRDPGGNSLHLYRPR